MSEKPYAALSDTVQMSGYLYKKSRQGQWQKRWFETNGCFLTYYKNRRMSKLLAALSLPQVGSIQLVPENSPMEDNDGCLFTIELNERVYTLRAQSREEAARWVEVLNQLKSGGSVGAPDPSLLAATHDGEKEDDDNDNPKKVESVGVATKPAVANTSSTATSSAAAASTASRTKPEAMETEHKNNDNKKKESTEWSKSGRCFGCC